MINGHFIYQKPTNEPVLNYAPGSPEKESLQAALKQLKSEKRDVPMYIGAEEVRTGKTQTMHPPHEHKHVLGTYHEGGSEHIEAAIEAALAAKKDWEVMPWEARAKIFLKAADLIAQKYRWEINAATMLGQSKNCYQAEIDSACELIDFLRFNVYFLNQIYANQPLSDKGIHNSMEYRALEGFVVAITPFNFTAIAGNLPSAPAMCGNTVVWKVAHTQVYSAHVIMKIFREAGLPDGVINLIYVDGPTMGDICFNHRDFAGLHFTGSSAVFDTIWSEIGSNLKKYRSYPRVVGETGGKDFVMVHPTAIVDAVVANLVRGAFEYQGQKCSAASRCYIPSNMADEVKEKLTKEIKSIKMGKVDDFGNFVNAVIDEKSFDKITKYIDDAKNDDSCEILVGGDTDKSKGYFVEPTVIVTTDPKYTTMCEEIFGPVLTMYVYDEGDFEATLELLDSTSDYALTGAIFSQDRASIELTREKLLHSAGNFYINDKPTGAVVGQQPFGGARRSGTNDKAGSDLNLLRWISVRTVKENFVPVTDYRYPFLG